MIDAHHLYDQFEREGGELRVPLGPFIDLFEANDPLKHLLRDFAEGGMSRHQNHAAKGISWIGASMAGGVGAGLKAGSSIGNAISKGRTKNRLKKNGAKIIRGFEIDRSIDGLKPLENIFLKGYTVLAARGHDGALTALPQIAGTIAWGNGTGSFVGDLAFKEPHYQEAIVTIANRLMAYICGGDPKEYAAWVTRGYGDLSKYLETHVPELHQELFFDGARWGQVERGGLSDA